MGAIWEENILAQGSSHNINVALILLNIRALNTYCEINTVQN